MIPVVERDGVALYHGDCYCVISVSWGNGNSDPVWSIDWNPPVWLSNRLPERSIR